MTRHVSMAAMLARRDRLDAEDEARVAAHIETCSECRERSAEYVAQTDYLRTFRREPAPPGLRAGVLAALDERRAGTPVKARQLDDARTSRARAGRWSRPALRWPGFALAAVLALLLAGVVPLVNQRPVAPVSAAEQLLRSATQAPAPSSGTAALIYDQPDDLTRSPVSHRLLFTWSASDLSHYVIAVRTVEPAIESGALTTVRNGPSMTQYDTRTDTAINQTSDLPEFLGVFGVFGVPGTALPPAFYPGRSIQRYLDLTQQDLPPSVHHFARVLGTQRLLGRQVQVVQFAPLTRGIQCLPTTVKNGIWQGSKDCNTPADYGTGTVWIDDATHIILRYWADLSDAPASLPQSGDALLQVTSFTPGRGATPAQLSQKPPVPAKPFTPGSGAIQWGDVAGAPAGQTVPVPAGFPPATPPSELPHAMTDLSEAPPTLLGAGVTGINLLFKETDGQHFRGGYVPGMRYLYVEERVRADDLPAELQSGTPVHAGTCSAWHGTTPDGLPTLAFAHGTVSVLMTSNSLSAPDLVSYTANTICKQRSEATRIAAKTAFRRPS